MRKTFPLQTNRNPRYSGLTLVELIVVVAILGVTAAIAVSGSIAIVRRARVNSVALEVAGWIERVRNAAADEVNPAANQGGCVLTFEPVASFAANTELADVDPDCALPLPGGGTLEVPALIVPANLIGTVTVQVVSGPNPITFTPRGLWIPLGAGDFQVNILLDGGGPLRCVRVSETLGSVDIGRANVNTINGAVCGGFQSLSP